MVRTLKLDQEKDKVLDEINTLQSQSYVSPNGLSRKNTYKLNFLQFKMHQLNLIENSNIHNIYKKQNTFIN